MDGSGSVVGLRDSKNFNLGVKIGDISVFAYCAMAIIVAKRRTVPRSMVILVEVCRFVAASVLVSVVESECGFVLAALLVRL